MLQSIRDNAKGWLAWVIVILISIPFALWGINEYLGPTQSAAVAEVNKVEISAAEYRQALQQRRAQMRSMLQNADIDLSFLEPQLKQDTLTQLINEELLIQTATESNMRIGDALLATHLHNYQVFQENGQFSQARYEQLLRAQGYSPVGFESEVRRDLLSAQLRGGVYQTMFLTEAAQQRQAQLQNQERQISYLLIPAAQAAGEVTFTDEEIEQYYQANIKNYKTEAKVRIEYVELSMDDLLKAQELDEEVLRQRYEERIANYTTPTRWKVSHILLQLPSDADETTEAAVKQQLQALRERVVEGEAFAALAKEYSDDVSTKAQGGNLDWFDAGTQADETLNPISPLIKETVANLVVGEISEPVKSQYGYHLIYLTEKEAEQTQPFAEVRETLAENLLQDSAELEFYGQAEQFANLAFEHPGSLDTLANSMQLEKQSTDFFTRKAQVADPQSILANRDVINAAFNEVVLEDGYNSEVIELGNEHVLVLRVLEHQPAENKPLADVRSQIEASLLEERQKTAAESLAKTLLDAIKQGESPNALAEQHDLTWTAAQWVGRDARLENKAALVQTTFKTAPPPAEQASYQQVALPNGDYAVLALLNVRTQVPEEITPKVTAENYGETQFNKLVADLRAEADITTYENNLE